MAVLLLLALKAASAFHGEDNNWWVQVDGMIDAAKCLRVSTITDLGAADANGATNLTIPDSNISCVVNGGAVNICNLPREEEVGSGAVEGLAEAQVAIPRPSTIGGCVFDETTQSATTVTGYAIDNTCFQNFIVQQLNNNDGIGAAPDKVYLRTGMPKHTRSCLLVGFCSASGYGLVRNVNAAGQPEYYNDLHTDGGGFVAELEQGAAGGDKMFDFLSFARGPERPPFPPATPPSPPNPPPGDAADEYAASTEDGYTYQLEPPGASGYVIHWALVSEAGAAAEPEGELEAETEAEPEAETEAEPVAEPSAPPSAPTGRRLSEAGSFVRILVVSNNPTGWAGVGFSPDGSMIGSDAVICWAGAVEMYALSVKSVPPGAALDPSPLTGASATVVDGSLRCEFTRPLTNDKISVPLTVASATKMLWAKGSNAGLEFHTDGQASYALRFDGQLAGGVALTPLQESKRNHGALMLVSWGFLLPAGSIIGRFYKHRSPIWFHLHRGIQVLGLILALAGWVVALQELGPFGGDAATNKVKVHGAIGCTVMTVGLLQPLNAFIRPHKGAKYRCAWEILHKGSGWCAIFLSIAVISLGISIIADQEPVAFPDVHEQFFGAYGASIGAIFLLAFFGVGDRHFIYKKAPEMSDETVNEAVDEEGNGEALKADAAAREDANGAQRCATPV